MRRNNLMRFPLLATLLTVFVVFVAGNAMAGWQEDQAALFKQIPVQPGDKIDSSNWEKVKDLLPPSVLEWVKKGDFVLDIGQAKWEMRSDAAWEKKTAANAGKYTIGPESEIFVKATGKSPEYVDGLPFPYAELDWKNDPTAGAKVIYNAFLKGNRAGQLANPYGVFWIGENGFEREVAATWRVRSYWMRPDGPTDNPSNLLMTELNKVEEPYDLAGILNLNQRVIENKPDQVYAYVPAIRRVKKVAGTTRSSPFLGTEFCNDDSFGWWGKNESMNWKMLDKKVVLVPYDNWAIEGPDQFVKNPDGSWSNPGQSRSPQLGFQTPGWKGAPWAPTDMKWIPREVYVVEATPKDPYYNYGKTIFYVDPETGFAYKVIFDTAKEYWKTLVISYAPAKWGNGNLTWTSATFYVAVNDKTHHATVCNAYGKNANRFFKVKYNDPAVKASMFSPLNLASQSK